MKEDTPLKIFVGIVFTLAIVVGDYKLFGPPIYFAKSVGAHVVDGDTGKPVDGANVIAAWISEGGFYNAVQTGIVRTTEATTDKNGKFHIDGWGPSFILTSYLDNYSPEIIIFRPGYKVQFLTNTGPDGWHPAGHPSDMVQTSVWNQKKIKLIPVQTLKQRLSSAHNLTNEMEELNWLEKTNCLSWLRYKKMLRAIINEQELLAKQGMDTSDVLSKENFLRTGYCGHPEKLFKAN